MDKYEYKVRADEIRSLIQDKKYKEAVEIADTIDWRNVKNIKMLCTVSDLYKACKRYKDSIEVLQLAYQRNPEGRMILYSLCELSIKTGDVLNAVEYYKSYARLAPQDTGKYILKYKLYTATEVSLEERIGVLEELKRKELKEKWMYELAYLYHMAGYGEQCVEECNQIILYFGEGKYVIKALELKALHEPLSAEQDVLYRKLTGPRESDIAVKEMDVSQYNTIDLEKELAEGLKEVLFDDASKNGTYENTEAAGSTENAGTGTYESGSEAAPVQEQTEENPDDAQYNTTVYAPIDTETADSAEATKVIDTDRVNAGLKEQYDPGYTGQSPAETSEPDNAPVQEAGYEEESRENSFAPSMESSEKPEETEEKPVDVPVQGTRVLSGDAEDSLSPRSRVIYPQGAGSTSQRSTGSGDIHEVQLGEINSPAIKFPNFDDMMTVEGDGQLSIVMPEQEKVDKQITGQISIDDVLMEWERMKNESEKKWQEDVRRRVQDQTTEIFKNFEESSKSGLLEELEDSVSTGRVELTLEEQKSLLAGENPEALNITIEDVMEAEQAEKEKAAAGEEGQQGEYEEIYLTEEECGTEETEAGTDTSDIENAVEEPSNTENDTESDAENTDHEEPVENSAEVSENVPAEDTVPEAGEAESEQTSDMHELFFDDPSAKEEPTPQELFFDRTPYINETEAEAASNAPEPDDPTNTQVLPNLEGMDYLMRFAQQAEERDIADGVIFGAAEAMIKLDSGEIKSVYELDPDEKKEKASQKTVETIDTSSEETMDAETPSEELSQDLEAEAAMETAGETEEAANEAVTETVEAVAKEEIAENVPSDTEKQEVTAEAEETLSETDTENTAEEADSSYINRDEETLNSENTDKSEEEAAETAGETEISEEPEEGTAVGADTESSPEAVTEAGSEIEGSEDENTETDGEETEEESEEPEIDEFGFTKTQRARYEDFIQTENGREQVLNALKLVSMESSTGNLIIGSDDQDSSVELGKAIITELAERQEITGKVAKIKASTLNAKDAETTLTTVLGGAIIIQDANELRPETLMGIQKVVSNPENRIFIVFTANHRLKHKFIMDNMGMLDSFNVSIDIDALEDPELVEFASRYAYSQEYSIDEMGMLALHTKIEELQTNAHNVRISDVKEIVDAAIDKAAKKNVGHFFEVLVGKRYDDNDMIVLKEKDFE